MESKVLERDYFEDAALPLEKEKKKLGEEIEVFNRFINFLNGNRDLSGEKAGRWFAREMKDLDHYIEDYGDKTWSAVVEYELTESAAAFLKQNDDISWFSDKLQDLVLNSKRVHQLDRSQISNEKEDIMDYQSRFDEKIFPLVSRTKNGEDVEALLNQLDEISRERMQSMDTGFLDKTYSSAPFDYPILSAAADTLIYIENLYLEDSYDRNSTSPLLLDQEEPEQIQKWIHT